MADTNQQWDLFICHASEDKADFVEPLANTLKALGVSVWYDKFIIKLGDSLSESIRRGLAKSDYGLVIISPSFIGKQWTAYELRGLTVREVDGKKKVILPLWHNVTKEQVMDFDLPLADKRALVTTGRSIGEIAVEIIDTIRPDLATRVHQRAEFLKIIDGAKIRRVDRSKNVPAPIRHKTLPLDLVRRIRLIRAALWPVAPHSMAYWLDGFMRDAHPSVQVGAWEHIATVYTEYVMAHRLSAQEHHEATYVAVRCLDDGNEDSAKDVASGLPDGAFHQLRELFKSNLPLFEIKEELPFTAEQMDAAEARGPLIADREHFPADPPEEVVRNYMRGQEPKKATTRPKVKKTTEKKRKPKAQRQGMKASKPR